MKKPPRTHFPKMGSRRLYEPSPLGEVSWEPSPLAQVPWTRAPGPGPWDRSPGARKPPRTHLSLRFKGSKGSTENLCEPSLKLFREPILIETWVRGGFILVFENCVRGGFIILSYSDKLLLMHHDRSEHLEWALGRILVQQNIPYRS